MPLYPSEACRNRHKRVVTLFAQLLLVRGTSAKWAAMSLHRVAAKRRELAWGLGAAALPRGATAGYPSALLLNRRKRMACRGSRWCPTRRARTAWRVFSGAATGHPPTQCVVLPNEAPAASSAVATDDMTTTREERLCGHLGRRNRENALPVAPRRQLSDPHGMTSCVLPAHWGGRRMDWRNEYDGIRLECGIPTHSEHTGRDLSPGKTLREGGTQSHGSRIGRVRRAAARDEVVCGSCVGSLSASALCTASTCVPRR